MIQSIVLGSSDDDSNLKIIVTCYALIGLFLSNAYFRISKHVVTLYIIDYYPYFGRHYKIFESIIIIINC